MIIIALLRSIRHSISTARIGAIFSAKVGSVVGVSQPAKIALLITLNKTVTTDRFVGMERRTDLS